MRHRFLASLLFVVANPLLADDRAAKPESPKRTKSVADLKAPPGYPKARESTVTPAEWKAYFADWGPGAFVEHQAGKGVTRQEILDWADGGVVMASTVRGVRNGKVIVVDQRVTKLIVKPDQKTWREKQRYLGLFIFSTEVLEAKTAPANKEFKVGDAKVTANELIEVSAKDGLRWRAWMSKAVPFGGLVAREGAKGDVETTLVAFGKGRE